MKADTWQFEAPWLQRTRGHPEAALGAAIWLWMHDFRHRREALKDIEHRLLAPIEAGQYLIARQVRTSSTPIDAPQHPLALLLFARFDEKAESRYLAAPLQKIAIRDWQSGDRLWLIDWVAPFGHTTNLRGPVMTMLAGFGARSLCRPRRGTSNQVRLWQRTPPASCRLESCSGDNDVRFRREAAEDRKMPAHR